MAIKTNESAVAFSSCVRLAVPVRAFSNGWRKKRSIDTKLDFILYTLRFGYKPLGYSFSSNFIMAPGGAAKDGFC